MSEPLAIKSVTVGELLKFIKEGGYSENTPIVLCSPVANGEVVALDIYHFETSLGDSAILLDLDLSKAVVYEEL